MTIDRYDVNLIARRLQDAAADPDEWPNVLEDLSRRVDGAGCILFSIDQRFKQNPCSPDLGPMTEQYFREGWHEIDLRYRGIPTMATTGIFTDFDAVGAEEMAASPFYRDFLETNNRKWFAGVGFMAGDDLWCLSIQRSLRQGPYQHSDLQNLTRLWQPFSDAATLAKRMSTASLEGMTFGLEAVGHAALVCDHHGNVMKVNSFAAELLGPLLTRTRELKLPYDAARTFETMLKRAMDPILRPGNETICCELALAGRKVKFRAIRLLGRMRYFFSQAHLLILMKVEQPSIEVTLRSRYQLSASEIRVTLALASGLKVEEIATQFAVKPDTIRTQLKSVFSKTNVGGQAQLVSLCHRLTFNAN